MQGRIKRGVTVWQDFGAGKWPQCKPPNSEYEGEEYQYLAKNPEMLFDVTWVGGDSGYWDCRADGYGYHRRDGGEYGCGSIFVNDRDGVELVGPND